MGKFNLAGASLLSACTGIFNASGNIHLTHWQLNSHLNLLHQGVLVRKVVSLPLHLLELVSASVGHLRGLPTLALGVSCSAAPSWPSGMCGTLPTSCCEDLELADPAA